MSDNTKIEWATHIVKTCRLVNNWIKVPNLEDKKGGNPFEWPEDVRVREFPEVR